MEITIHEEKISHFTFHGKKRADHDHENTLYHPHTREQSFIKGSHRESEIRSAHSRIILAEISRPVALDVHNLFTCEKTILLLVEKILNLL